LSGPILVAISILKTKRLEMKLVIEVIEII